MTTYTGPNWKYNAPTAPALPLRRSERVEIVEQAVREDLANEAEQQASNIRGLSHALLMLHGSLRDIGTRRQELHDAIDKTASGAPRGEAISRTAEKIARGEASPLYMREAYAELYELWEKLWNGIYNAHAGLMTDHLRAMRHFMDADALVMKIR